MRETPGEMRDGNNTPFMIKEQIVTNPNRRTFITSTMLKMGRAGNATKKKRGMNNI